MGFIFTFRKGSEKTRNESEGVSEIRKKRKREREVKWEDIQKLQEEKNLENEEKRSREEDKSNTKTNTIRLFVGSSGERDLIERKVTEKSGRIEEGENVTEKSGKREGPSKDRKVTEKSGKEGETKKGKVTEKRGKEEEKIEGPREGEKIREGDKKVNRNFKSKWGIKKGRITKSYLIIA